MADNKEKLDANGMEDFINKILEKYGETDNKVTGVTASSEDAVMRKDEETKKQEHPGRTENDVSHVDFGGKDDETYGRAKQSGAEREFSSYRPGEDAAIGSVIRSQTGVAQQLITVTAGLDQLDAELENMKREIKRVQSNAYSCQTGGGSGGLDTSGVGRESYRYSGLGDLGTSGASRDTNRYSGLESLDTTGLIRETHKYSGLGSLDTSGVGRDTHRYTGLGGLDTSGVSRETHKYSGLGGLGTTEIGRETHRYSGLGGSDTSGVSAETSRYSGLAGLDTSGVTRETYRYSGLGGLGSTSDIGRESTKSLNKPRVSWSTSNLWEEEREGIMKIDDGDRVVDTGRWKSSSPVSSYLPSATSDLPSPSLYLPSVSSYLPAASTYLPGSGRTHIGEDDVQVANLLTIADEPKLTSRFGSDQNLTSRLGADLNLTSRLGADQGVPKQEKTVTFKQGRVPVVRVFSVDEGVFKRDDDIWSVKSEPRMVKKDGYYYYPEGWSGRTNTTTWNKISPWSDTTTWSDRTKTSSWSDKTTPWNDTSTSWSDRISTTPRRDTLSSTSGDTSTYLRYSTPREDLSRSTQYSTGLGYDRSYNTLQESYNIKPRLYRSHSQLNLYSGDTTTERPLASEIRSRSSYVGSSSSYYQPLSTTSQSYRPVSKKPEFSSRFLDKVRKKRRNSLGGGSGMDRDYRSSSVQNF